jgi:hypothetical protein
MIDHLGSIHFSYAWLCIENTPFQLDQREKVQEHYTLVKHYFGKTFLLDATQCGSYAHRLRN